MQWLMVIILATRAQEFGQTDVSHGEDVMRKLAKSILILGSLATCMAAQAQNRVFRSVGADNYADVTPSLNVDTSLRKDLERAGVISRTGPFRVALPVARFGENGPKLMFTYVPHMKDDAGSKVFMLFMRFDLD